MIYIDAYYLTSTDETWYITHVLPKSRPESFEVQKRRIPMNLVVRDPFLEDFTALTSRFNHFFDSPRQSNVDYLGAWNPAVDIFDKGAEVVIHAELPGIKKEDIDVRVENNVLTIRGKKERKEEAKG